MTIEAELHDGTVLEFPDNTSPEVVQATVKKMLGQSAVPSMEALRGQGPKSDPMLSWKNIGQFATRNAPEIGSIVGGVAGAASPLPGGLLAGSKWGSILGSLLGTVAGTSIGTSAKQILDEKEKSPIDRLKEQGKNVAEQAAYDVAGSAIGAGIGKVASKMMPPAREGAEMAQSGLTSKGSTLTGAQAVESPSIDLIESFARAGAGGKGQFIALEKRSVDALDALKQDLISKFGSSPASDVAAGKAFQSAIKRGEDAHSVASNVMYEAFDKKAGNILVDAGDLTKFGQEIVERFKRIGDVGKTDAGGRLMDQLSNIPPQMTFADAHNLRSNLLARVRDLKASGQEAKALALAAEAAQRVDKAMESAAKGLPGNVFDDYRKISAFYKKGKEAFNNDIIQEAVTKNPERVGEYLFKSGNVTEVIQARASLRQAQALDKTVDAAETLNKMRAGYLNNLLTTKSAVSKEGETTAQNLMKELASAKNTRQFQVMFSGEQRKAIDDFARTAYLVLNNKPSNFGVLAPLLQAAAIADLVSGEMGGPSTQSPLKDVGVIVSPYVFAKVLTNPKAVNVLIKGLKMPPVLAATPQVITKLTADFVSAMKETPPE